jgi:hypothetical protein
LRIASPLTLSEVRSMLPPGIATDVLAAADLLTFRRLLPTAQTAAHLRVGSCSCDLVRPRHPDQREDERDLRRRYSRLGLSRERIISELERHRRHAGAPAPPGGWTAALAGFVAEHARNAGATLYHLVFQPAPPAGGIQPLTRTVAQVRAEPGSWLREGEPVLVLR